MMSETATLTGQVEQGGIVESDGHVESNKTLEMLKKTVILQLDTHRFGVSRQVDNKYVHANTDKSSLRVTKRLLQCDVIKALENFDGATREWVKSQCPPTVIRKGLNFVPIGKIEFVDARLRALSAERQGLVQAACDALDAVKLDDQQRLGELYVEADYPTPAALAAEYSMSWMYVSFDTPSALKEISPQLFQQEQAKQQKQWSEAADMTQQLLRARALGMVEKLNERLVPSEDGKLKTFRNKRFTDITEFLADFDMLNITDDEQLGAAVAKMRDLLDGVNPDQVRKDENFRASLQSEFAAIGHELSEMVTDKPTRAISFEQV